MHGMSTFLPLWSPPNNYTSRIQWVQLVRIACVSLQTPSDGFKLQSVTIQHATSIIPGRSSPNLWHSGPILWNSGHVSWSSISHSSFLGTPDLFPGIPVLTSGLLPFRCSGISPEYYPLTYPDIPVQSLRSSHSLHTNRPHTYPFPLSRIPLLSHPQPRSWYIMTGAPQVSTPTHSGSHRRGSDVFRSMARGLSWSGNDSHAIPIHTTSTWHL